MTDKPLKPLEDLAALFQRQNNPPDSKEHWALVLEWIRQGDPRTPSQLKAVKAI